MTADTTFHPEVLPIVQREVLNDLGPWIDEQGFYLAGGTGLALQLGHRRSEDFDWFRPQAFADPLFFAAELQRRGMPVEVLETAPGTLHARSRGVRLTFLEYPYSLQQEPILWPQPGCHIAMLDDLASMKLAALAQRGSRKDFVDIYALVKSGISLESMLNGFKAKYQISNIAHLLVALAYFEDAEREPMPTMLWDVDWPTMKRQLQDWLKGFTTG